MNFYILSISERAKFNSGVWNSTANAQSTIFAIADGGSAIQQSRNIGGGWSATHQSGTIEEWSKTPQEILRTFSGMPKTNGFGILSSEGQL